MAKPLNVSLVKAHMPYRFEDLAELLNISVGTLKKRVKQVPECVTEGQPSYVIGRVFKRHFENEKAKQPKKKPNANFRCMPCGQTVRPLGGMLDVETKANRSQVQLKGLCPHCEGVISKFASKGDRLLIEADLGEPIEGDWRH